MKLTSLLNAFAVVAYSSVTFAVETVNLEPDMPYKATRLNPVSYDVDFSVVVTPPYHAKVLKVWLPIPQSDFGQEFVEGQLTTFPMEVEPRIGIEKVYGNKFAYFEFHEPHGAQVIRHQFKITVWELRWNLNPHEVVLTGKWPGSFDKYRRGESQAVVVNDDFRALLDEIIPNRDNPLEDMATVMNWTIGEFKYDHVDAWLQASASHALNNRHGHCSDYHGFCASMGRVLGSPTRVTYGIATFPKNSPSHCKLESFLPPYGWVSFDVSETQKLMAAIRESGDLSATQQENLVEAAQNRLIHGFRENTWFVQTKGTDYELEPRASKRTAVVRTAYIEADGKPLPEPDPANREKQEFSWMTVHRYTSDKATTNAFKDLDSLGDFRVTR